MPWKPGESGNPEGRQRPPRFKAALERALASDDYQALRRIADKVVGLAEEGERWAVELLRDTIDGKPAQQVIATDQDGRPLAVGLIAYASQPAVESVRLDDPVPIPAQGLPAPSIEGTGQRH